MLNTVADQCINFGKRKDYPLIGVATYDSTEYGVALHEIDPFFCMKYVDNVWLEFSAEYSGAAEEIDTWIVGWNDQVEKWTLCRALQIRDTSTNFLSVCKIDVDKRLIYRHSLPPTELYGEYPHYYTELWPNSLLLLDDNIFPGIEQKFRPKHY